MIFLILYSSFLFSINSYSQEEPITLVPLKPLPTLNDPTPSPTPGSVAPAGKVDRNGEFHDGSSEFDPVYYTPAYINKMIVDNMVIQCDRGLCEMAMVDTQGRSFVVEFNSGYGNQNGVSTGGGGSPGGGSVVVVGTGNYNYKPQPYFGLSIRYVNQKCKQSVRVPVSLYVSLNTYLFSLINEDGTTRRTFDPAEQTMILFYTTVMKQATGCSAPTH
jgi:hypothetical protein